VFFRPKTRHYLESHFGGKQFTLRPVGVICTPKITDIINQRLKIFLSRFKCDETIIFEIKGKKYILSPKDCTEAIMYLVGLTSETVHDILPKLTEKINGSDTSNIRAGLQTLIGILGSRVITDEDYIKAIQLYKESLIGKTVFEKWPTMLEAIILGRRLWYSPTCGVIENLIGPPQVEESGDYFSIIHCLQVLLKNNKNKVYNFGTIKNGLELLGYSHSRISEILKFLADRKDMLTDSQSEEYFERMFPLVTIKTDDLDTPINVSDVLFTNETTIYITPWGEYHLTLLLYQMQYWKHIFYQTTLPQSLIKNLNIDHVNSLHVSDLYHSLELVISYLSKIEKSWLSGLSEYKLKELGIHPIMGKVSEEIGRQYDRIVKP
jgi:hypothetical protein